MNSNEVTPSRVVKITPFLGLFSPLENNSVNYWTCFLAIWMNSCGESGQETTSSRLCWKKLLGNMRSNMMADKSQNRLLLEPTKTSKVNNKPNCSNKLCFPLILILIIFYIFEGGAYIWILKETHVWGGLYLNHDSSIRYMDILI